MPIKKRQILLMSVSIEGLLIIVFLVWSILRSRSILPPPTIEAVLHGLALTIPLLVVNYIFFGPLAHILKPLKSCLEFKNVIVKPLADELDLHSALIVSILAGLGEELFFRGVLQNEFGLVVASVVFAILHFGPAVRHYPLISSLYLLFGFYFGVTYAATGSLWTVIVMHTAYDFLALVYLKHFCPRFAET